MNGRCRCILFAGMGFMMSLLCAPGGSADTLIVGDSVESTTGGFKFPDGTTQTTAYTGGAGGGITLTSPDGSITVGGTSTTPTVKLNFTLTDALYAPFSGSTNYAPASGSSNYLAKSGDTMSGPLNVSIGSGVDAISGITSGSGKAGYFQINNSSSGSHALYVTTNGTGFGHSVYSYSTGLSRAGVFEINNPANGGEAVLARTNGSGAAVHGYATGSGNGGIFDINNAANSSDALYVTTNGTGRAGYFQINRTGNGSDALYATTNGTGKAGSFQINNSSSGSHALYVTTNGTGSGHSVYSYSTGLSRAGVFEIHNPANGGEAVLAMTNGSGAAVFGNTTGTGNAGMFAVSNAANSSDALYATTTGSGNAGNFNGKVNVSGTLTTAGFKLTGGAPGAGKILTSDATGTASWQTSATMTGPLVVSIASVADAISGTNSGLGKAGYFQINNSSSGSHALYVTTNGTGSGHSVYSYSTGLSRAGVFEINNPANGGETVLAKTNGSGAAVHGYATGTGNGGIFDINNAANISDALYATTNGTGSAIKGVTTGSGYAGYFQGGAGLYVDGNLTVSGTGAMPVYDNTGAAQAAPHMVTGTILVNGAGAVTLSGSAVFSSAGSYTCTASSSSAVFPVAIQINSGSSFTLSGGVGNVNYICVGT